MGITPQVRATCREEARENRAEVSRHAGAMPGSAVLAKRNRVLEDQLTILRRERDDLQRAMFDAAQMQRRLCGPRLLRREAFEIASELFPVSHLSGDFITVFEFDTDLMFAIGDIGGKGLFAGLWFTYVVGMLRLQIEAQRDPAVVLSAINHNLLVAHLELPLTTVLLGRLDLRTGEITYCSAGHPPALVFRYGGHVESLNDGGPILGVLANANFSNGRTALNPGDTLLAYSDGIAECRSENGVEFGRERLVSAVQRYPGSGASHMLFSLLGAVEDFTGSHSREDDIALIVIRRTDS